MKRTKLVIFTIFLSNITALTSAFASYTHPEINEVLRTNGPIFLRTSDDFSPNKMEYLAADSNGNAYDIEGYPVKLTLTGIANFHGEFIPAKILFPESEHKFVGHAEVPVNTGRLIVEIGAKKKSYRLKDNNEVIKDTITVNNSIYEISIQFSQSSLKEVLFKNDPDKTKATSYFIAIDGIKWVSYTPQYTEVTQKLKLIEAELAQAALQETKEKAKASQETPQEMLKRLLRGVR